MKEAQIKVSASNFEDAADKVVNRVLREGLWTVYDLYDCDYSVDGRGPCGGSTRVCACAGAEGGERLANGVSNTYAPLMDENLFLSFAQLVEKEQMDTSGVFLTAERLGGVPALADDLDTEKNRKVAVRWVEGYGVLGATPHPRHDTWWSDPRGGTGDTVKRFVYEAWTANRTLRLYEAATAGPDGQAIEEILQVRGFRSLKQARDAALDEVDEQIQSRMKQHCFPQSFRRPDGERMRGYGFRSLLGAMWIQMWWLFTENEEQVRRCPWCNGVISFQRGIPPQNPGLKRNVRGKSKTRKDKRFCDDNCRAKYDYYFRRRRSR